MGSRHTARILAFQGIYSWDVNKLPAENITSFEWADEKQRDGQTMQFASLLLTGTLEKIDQIDALIKANIQNWDFSRLSRVDLAILRLSVYSLQYQKDIPSTITIDEAINLAREFGNDDSYRFVNGVLDGIKNKI